MVEAVPVGRLQSPLVRVQGGPEHLLAAVAVAVEQMAHPGLLVG